jgi:putative endonuclease
MVKLPAHGSILYWVDLQFVSDLAELNVDQRDHHYYVYIVAGRTRVLYCGMTNDLRVRVVQHKNRTVPGFTDSFNCNRLVWFERYQYVRSAIAREKQIKGWTRAKKLALINEMDSSWADLSEEWD